MLTRCLVFITVAVMALTALLSTRVARPAENSTVGWKTISLGDFETGLDGYKGKIVRDPTVAKVGKASAKIEADFGGADPAKAGKLKPAPKGQAWETASRTLEVPHEFKQVRFWVRSTDASGLTWRLIDETGQTHQQRPKFPADGQWHQITINTFTAGEGYQRFGGAADGRFHWPAQSIGFTLEKGNLGDKTSGALWIDGVEATIDPRPYVPDLRIDQVQLGNIFLTTETPMIPVRSGGDRISWTVTAYGGAKAAAGITTVKDGKAMLEPGVKGPGYFEVTLAVEKAGVKVADGKTTFAVLTPIDVEQMKDSPFGVMTHFAQGWDLDIMPLVAKAGIRTIRDEQYWGHVEKKRGEFEFPGRLKAYMAEAQKFHLDPLVAMTFENKLYDEGLTPHTPAGCKAYGRYGQAIIDEYGPQIQWLEIWNEYNGTWCKGPAATDRPKFYAQMLQHAYQAIKAKRPDVKVGGGAAVLLPPSWFEGIFKNGGLQYMDAVVIHPYRGEPEGVEEEIAELKNLMKKYNRGATKPIWVTETGRSDDTPEGRTRVARYLVRMYTLLLSEDCERICWYLMRDYQNFKTMGLLYGDKEPMGRYVPAPAYAAYANLIRQLSGAKCVRREATDRWTRIYLFRKGSEEIRVCWSTAPTTVTFKAAGPLTGIDLVGGQQKLEQANGGVRLPLTTSPVYVKGAVTAIGQPPSPIVADSVMDYTNVQGKMDWSYGYFDGAAPYKSENFKPMEYVQTMWGYEWRGPHKYLKLTREGGHPEAAAGRPVWAIRRWKSSFAGTLRIRGNITRGDTKGDGTGALILADGREVFSRLVGGPGREPNIEYEVRVPVKEGTLFDFIITPGPATDTSYDATQFTVRIERLKE
jgi:hypothetical protein